MKQKKSIKVTLVFIYLLIIASVIQATVSVKVYSRDEVLKTFNASKPRIYIKNTGTEAISNVHYNYYFETENGKVPLLGDYYTPVENVSLVADSGSKYHIKYVVNTTIMPGQISPDIAGNLIGLNYNTWDAWDKTNDYSNTMDSSFLENQKITVYVNNVKIYGTEPGGTAPPPPSSSDASVQLNSFALYSTQGTMLRDRSSFTGGGAVGSNTSVDVGASTIVNGNVVSAGTVLLRAGASITGIVYANGTVTQEAGVILSNPVHNNAGLGMLTIPAIAVTAGLKDTIAYSNRILVLAIGIYRNLIVQTNGTIKFQPGNYSFNSFIFQNDAHAIFTVAMDQSLEIDVAGEFEINDRATMQFSGAGYSPAVKIHTNDPNTIRIGCDSKTAGIIYAPNAEISVFSRAQCDGAIYAKKITVEPDAKVYSGLVNPGGDADNDHVPNLLEVQTGTNPSDPRSFKMMAIPHPVTIDNRIDQVVYYSLSDFYEDYSNTDSLAMNFPAGALGGGETENLPINVSNSPVDFAGNAIAPPEIPTGMSIVGRYIAIDQGELTPDISFDMSIPVPDADINNSSQYSVIYTSGSGDWTLADALTSVDSDGKITVTATVINPLVVALVCKRISATAYLDDGVVFSNEKQYLDAELDINLQCKGFTVNGVTGTLKIYYTDYAIPATPVEKTFLCPLVRMTQSYSPLKYNLVCTNRIYKFPNKIKVTKTEFVFSDVSLNSSSVQNLTVNPNECLKIAANKNLSLFKPGIDPLTCQFVNRYSFESADIDGEGRIHKSNAGVFSYDFYLKDHLGSTRAVVNDVGNVTEATDYLPYGTMVSLMLAPMADNAREKFTGKEFDSGVNPISEVSFDIKINNFDAGGRYSGIMVVDYTDLSNNKLIRKCYSLNYDPIVKKFTLNTAERFPVNVKVINIRIATTGYVTRINYQKSFDRTVATDNGLAISLDVNGSDLITNAGTDYYTTSTYVPYRVAGSNLYYFGARYYDPEIGTWTSTDPADQYWNAYSYVGGRPTVIIDPYGMNGVWAIGMLIGAAIGGTAGYIASDGDWGVAAGGAVLGGMAGAGIGSSVDWALESMGYNINYAAAMQAVQRAASPDIIGNLVLHSVQGSNLVRPFTSAPNFTLPISYGDHAFLGLEYNENIKLYNSPGNPLEVFGTWPEGLKTNSKDELYYRGQSSRMSYPITKTDLSKIGRIINDTRADQAGAWTPLSPCSDFAADTWQSISGEKLTHRHALIRYSDPNVLSRSINKSLNNEIAALEKMAEKIR